ncbi:LysR family transcriptional regulator [Pigmentiphaga litoralis]|uniref:LysR family transcriptional regulator of gallate degradation n=1 Tax=Pigmentiphaga litoralis TaxID=516702 RepID=A0A7Y9LLN5_9BURK|nr:LysR family transcriptional regulator [Pigmentiphaga litoralis]NYE24981.1 LysR family transcriptional regulator of gallate degradation [Pigmentiphaga litoralis]NYE81405.1 LysR family transcriptional regulator of gallate degradation [Pigmentiphaga litoralis]
MRTLTPHLKKLRAVRAVAEHGSTARAAASLFLSQPAVARAVRDVEALLDMTLFDRSARGMELTELGQVLDARLKRAFAQLRAADRGVTQLAAGHRLAHHRSESQLETQAGYRHLSILMALDAAGSESRCAEALGISQPAVTQAIAQLEHLAGVRLFHRSARGMRLTEPGDALLRHARLLWFELDSASADLASRVGQLQGRVVIGTLPFSTGLFVPRAVERLLANHPAVNVTIVDGTYETLLHRLRHAELDMVIGALRQPPPADDLHQEPLFDDELAVVVRQGHPLQGRMLRGLADLVHASWILPMPNTPAQSAFERAFHSDGLSPPTSGLQVNSPALTQALLMESDRVVLMSPRQISREVKAGLLALLPVTVRMTTRAIGLTTRTDYLPSPGVAFLLDALRDTAADLG